MADYSTYTLAQLEALYDANAAYREENSVAKARIFVSVCIILVRRYDDKMQQGETVLEKRVSDLREEKRAALAWLDANDTSSAGGMGPRVTRADLRNVRT